MKGEAIHHVSCTIHSEADRQSTDFVNAEIRSKKLRLYAQQLGFDVMYENVDTDD